MFRRLYPKIRLSWSVVNKYLRGDIQGIKDYIIEKDFSNEAMHRGKLLHEALEMWMPKLELKLGKDPIQEYRFELETPQYIFTGVIDYMDSKVLVDWKTGSINGYAKQLNLYNWALKELGHKDREMYIVKVNDELAVEAIRKTRLKEENYYELLDKVYNFINTYIRK